MDDNSDNTVETLQSETPENSPVGEQENQAPLDIEPAAQQEAETGEGEAEKAEPSPEPYVLDLGEYGKDIPPEESEFITKLAQESGASPEAASQLMQKMALYNRTAQEVQAEEWAELSKADKEFGGAKFNENIAVAKRALQQFGSQELVQMLDNGGMGNHPEVIRFLVKVGNAISEDKFVGGSPRGRNPGEIDLNNLYPNM